MKFNIAIAALLAGLSASAAQPAGNIEARIDELLGKMTIEEKIGQLNQYTGSGYSPDMSGRVKAGMVGSILNEVNPETVNALQRDAVENSRLGIPLVFARDVIHGFRTIFPIPLGQGATWNPALVEEGSAIAAREASSAGIRWTFSPMVDIARDARWGRIAEGYGEDPVLTSAMGVAAIKGYQGDDLSAPGTMAACVKHFACYGAAESGRDYNTTWVPMELLHDVYLPPFEAGAKAGAATFMCSFNDINGVPSSGNSYLLRDILRDKWQWDGLMVSDWNSISEMINHGFCADRSEAALKAALAGVDMDMEGHAYDNSLATLVKDGSVPMDIIDNMVRNVLRLKFRLGLFENPYVDMATANNFYTPEALDAARRTAEESAILLKNSGILPLGKRPGKIFVTGPMADAAHDQNGTWCFDLDKTRTVTPLTSLREKYGNAVSYSPGLTYSRDKNTDFGKAVEMAADTVFRRRRGRSVGRSPQQGRHNSARKPDRISARAGCYRQTRCNHNHGRPSVGHTRGMSAQPGRAVLIPSRDHGWPRSCECTFGRCRSRWPTAGVHAAHVGSDAPVLRLQEHRPPHKRNDIDRRYSPRGRTDIHRLYEFLP